MVLHQPTIAHYWMVKGHHRSLTNHDKPIAFACVPAIFGGSRCIEVFLRVCRSVYSFVDGGHDWPQLLSFQSGGNSAKCFHNLT